MLAEIRKKEYLRTYQNFRGPIITIITFLIGVYAVGQGVYYALLSFEAFASSSYMIANAMFTKYRSECFSKPIHCRLSFASQ